jgi:hypothetical protein
VNVPTADMEEVLSLLSGIADDEGLDAAWPRISALLRKLDAIVGRRKRPMARRPRPTRDGRDGSPVPARIEVRMPVPDAFNHFAGRVRSIVEGNPAFRGRHAAERRAWLLRVAGKWLGLLRGEIPPGWMETP